MDAIFAPTNRLYYGDNLHVLRKLVKDESVDLAYIDPPFNSKRQYFQIYKNVGGEDRAQAQAFIDTWEWDEIAGGGLRQILENEVGRFTPQSVELIKGLRNVLKEGSLLAYLVSMTLRIVEIHRVLKPTGSFYLHCDQSASHYLKLVCDAIFVTQGGDYRDEIIWKRRVGSSSAVHGSNKFGICTDTIFFYVKSQDAPFNPQYNMNDPDYQRYVTERFKHVDAQGRRYRLDNLTNPAYRPNLIYDYKGYQPTKNGWAISRDKMEQWDKEGRLEFPKKPTGRIQRKRFLEELKGKPVQNLWTDIAEINSQAAERLGYPTQKPEALLERIIKASSNEGETVLDAFCGCGTTVAMAQKLKRRWIGIDITYQSISLVLKRLEDTFGPEVLKTISLNGIPKDMASATALANKNDDRVRKEFEKWAVLSYSNNRATINEKKGADQGVDGTAYFMTAKTENEKILFQVKSGNVGPKDIRDLRGTMEQEKAALGIFITLHKSTRPMDTAAHAAGTYQHVAMGRSYNRIQIVTIKDMIEKGARLEMPLSLDVVKSASRLAAEAVQLELETPAA